MTGPTTFCETQTSRCIVRRKTARHVTNCLTTVCTRVQFPACHSRATCDKQSRTKNFLFTISPSFLLRPVDLPDLKRSCAGIPRVVGWFLRVISFRARKRLG